MRIESNSWNAIENIAHLLFFPQQREANYATGITFNHTTEMTTYANINQVIKTNFRIWVESCCKHQKKESVKNKKKK